MYRHRRRAGNTTESIHKRYLSSSGILDGPVPYFSRINLTGYNPPGRTTTRCWYRRCSRTGCRRTLKDKEFYIMKEAGSASIEIAESYETHTLQEILTQPVAWKAALTEVAKK